MQAVEAGGAVVVGLEGQFKDPGIMEAKENPLWSFNLLTKAAIKEISFHPSSGFITYGALLYYLQLEE